MILLARATDDHVHSFILLPRYEMRRPVNDERESALLDVLLDRLHARPAGFLAAINGAWSIVLG